MNLTFYLQSHQSLYTHFQVGILWVFFEDWSKWQMTMCSRLFIFFSWNSLSHVIISSEVKLKKTIFILLPMSAVLSFPPPCSILTWSVMPKAFKNWFLLQVQKFFFIFRADNEHSIYEKEVKKNYDCTCFYTFKRQFHNLKKKVKFLFFPFKLKFLLLLEVRWSAV